MFQGLEHKFQDLVHMFQGLEHKFQGLEYKKVLEEKTFSPRSKEKNCGKWKEALLRSIPNWDNKVSQINIGLIEERKTSHFFTFPGCFSTLRLRLSTYGAQEVANLCAEHFSLFTLFCTFAPNIT